MSSIPSVFAPIAVLILLSCVSPVLADDLRVRTLAKGPFSGIQDARQEIIKDKTAWDQAWAKHTSGRKSSDKVPEVDFSKEMVILVTMGQQSTGGYSIEVTKVEAVNDKLRVSVSRKTPPAGAMTTQALTAPFHFAAVPISSLKPEFIITAPNEKRPVKP